MSAARRIRAVFMRGGTSKALVFRREDLPEDRAEWDALFLGAIGSPDPYGRQLNGMGGGISSLSKICVVGPPSRPDADVDYTFAQAAVKQAAVDYKGNCGNMSSAIGPFAVDEGLVSVPDGEACVRIHNTNTGKIIAARFAVSGGRAVEEGGCVIPGVAGSGAPIRLAFLSPGGANTGSLLPTGRPSEALPVPGLGGIEASLVDAAAACVFVDAAHLGLTAREHPEEIERNAGAMARLETIRRLAGVRMGLAATPEGVGMAIPRVAVIAAPADSRLLSGETLAAADCDLLIRMISVGQPHRAVPVTGALCVAAAARIAGSVVARLARPAGETIRIGHPSGVTEVAADVGKDAEGAWTAREAVVWRTTRRLMEGAVLVPQP
ncbi:MAG: 2-methylaconitate cis-trans isomerase PrpF family protein [Rhodospirillaceae bacterium]